MSGTDRTRRFEAALLPHLDAAYNLARWLLRDDQAAQDVVQEAYLRALKFFDGFRGGDARPWLLGIVRNECFTWLGARGREHVEFDEERDSGMLDPAFEPASGDPERQLQGKLERAQVNAAIAALPAVFRDVLILRELEELSYDEIAQVVGIPAGTVMSRLSRARSLLRAALIRKGKED
ncbi:MAG: sigma-70 family RNA polymerase sigma factor [Pseudomonadota bacterium]